VIASQMANRSASQVAARWEKCLDPRLSKGAFTSDEDQAIREHVKNHGPQNWPAVSQVLKNRSPKQCRERWFNHLDPSVSVAGWTLEEDTLIFEGHECYGPKWSLISKALPGRTDNAIKNRWNSSISKRVQLGPNGRRVLVADAERRRRNPARPPPIQTVTPIAAPSTSIVAVDLSRLAPWQIALLAEMNILPGSTPAVAERSPAVVSPLVPFLGSNSPSPYGGFSAVTTPGQLLSLGDGADSPFSPWVPPPALPCPDAPAIAATHELMVTGAKGSPERS
jgi:hypothetical protein